MPTLDFNTRMNSKPVTRGLDKIESRTKKFSRQLKSLGGVMAGAFSAAAVTGLIRKTIDYGSTLSDLAKQSGLSTDEFQALERMAIKAGVPVEKIRTAMMKLNVVMGQAKSGMKTYTDLFTKAGITTRELNTLNPAQMFERLAQNMASAERGSKEFGAGLELLGTRSAGQLIEVFERLNEKGLAATIAEFKRLNKILDTDTVKALDDAKDSIELFTQDVTVFTGKLLTDWRTLIDRAKTFRDVFGKKAAGGREKTLTGLAGAFNPVNLVKSAVSAHKELDSVIAKRDAKEAVAQRKREKSGEVALDVAKQMTAETTKQAAVKGSKIATDRLAKIGGFLGGSAAPVANTPMDKLNSTQTEMLNELKRNPQEIANALKGMGSLESV